MSGNPVIPGMPVGLDVVVPLSITGMVSLSPTSTFYL